MEGQVATKTHMRNEQIVRRQISPVLGDRPIQTLEPKVVSERLEHSTIALTLDTYSHVLPDMESDAAEKVDEALAGVFVDQG